MDPNHPQPAAGAAPGTKPDYLDKAFEQGAKKFGGAQGQKIAGNKATSEKIVRLAAIQSLSSCCALREMTELQADSMTHRRTASARSSRR